MAVHSGSTGVLSLWNRDIVCVEQTQCLCGTHTVSLCGTHTVQVGGRGGAGRGGRFADNANPPLSLCYAVAMLGELQPAHFAAWSGALDLLRLLHERELEMYKLTLLASFE